MKNKLKKLLIFGSLAVVLGIATALVLLFGLKKDPAFTVKLDTFTTDFASDSNASGSINSKEKTLTVKNMEYGDSVSFYIRMSNTTKDNYNYRIRITSNGETPNTQLASNLVFEMYEETNPITIYGNSEKIILQRSINAEVNNSIIRVKVSLPEIEGFDVDNFESRECSFKFHVDSSKEEDNVDYDKQYSEVTTNESLSLALQEEESIILLNSIQSSYTLENPVTIAKSLKIYGEHGAKNTINGSFVVGPNGTLEVENAVLNGHIQTIAEIPSEGEEQNEGLKATALEEGTEFSQSVITLNNVTINGSDERINSTGAIDTRDSWNNETKPAIMIESNTKLEIIGQVKALGNWDAAGIGVAKDAAVEITGDTLTTIGNGGYEVMPTDNEYYKSKEQVQKLSTDPEFSSHLVNDATIDTNPDFFVDWYNAGVAGKSNKYGVGRGSGIGSIYSGKAVGKIYIHDLKSLTAEGYGSHAFGIGGDVEEDIVIERTTIEKARGGYAVQDITDYDSYYYAKGTTEGGAAIGISNQDFDGTMETKNPSIPATAGIILNEVTVNAAYGGHKHAGIGAAYWSPAKVIITNSQIKNTWGGTYGAGIGGSRIGTTHNQDVYIEINDSNVEVYGGAYGAGIGSGSTVYTRRADDGIHPNRYPQAPKTTINISGISDIDAIGGIGGAGIGSGYQVGRAYGTIASTVDISDVHGGGYGDIVSIRGKTTDYNGETVKVYTYKFGEFAGSGNIWTYYVPVANDESTPTQEELAKMEFVGDIVITKPEDIGLGSQCGQWVVTSAQLIAAGLADIDHKTGELKNNTDIARAVEIYNASVSVKDSLDSPIDETTAATFTSMQDFVDYVYNTPKGYELGDENYHTYDPNKDYFVKSGIVIQE